MKALERIRKAIRKNQEEMIHGGMEPSLETLKNLWRYDKAERVHTDSREGRRPPIRVEIDVFKVETEDETAYFQTDVEVNTMTDTHETVIVKEVFPKKVTVTQYVDKALEPDRSKNHG